MRKNSIKNTRINAEVQKELSNIIRGEIKDPRIHPMTSVMAVEVAPDLKTCKAFISVLGSEESKQSTIKGLKSAEGYIRRQLAKNLNLRNTPEIRFILDESIEYGVNMSRLIDDVIEHDHSKGTEQEKDISRFSDLEVGKVNSHYHEYAEQHHKGANPCFPCKFLFVNDD